MEGWDNGIMSKRKEDAEKRRLGDAEKNSLFLPISVSAHHPIRILTQSSGTPILQQVLYV